MAKVIFKHEKVEMIQQDKPVVFLCHHCKQSANEAPVRANYTDKKVLTYHPHCAREVISEISNPKRKYEDTSMKDLGIVGISGKSVNVKKQTFIQPVVDLDLERKKAKLEALLAGDQYREEVEEEEDRQSKKLKAHITLEPNGMLGFRHKYDAEMVKKYHMIREIKWNNGFNIWECNIKAADYETVRFILKIFKEAEQFDWLISDQAFTAIKSRLDHHESRIKESKEIKELKTKTDIEIELPHLKITPYPYQKVGIAFLDKVNGVGMVGDTMGLGKSLEAIGYTSLKNLRTIIVCPASLKYNWKKEIEKFSNKSAVVLTELEAASLDHKNTLADYRIINYEQLDKYSKYLSKTKFDCVILDESHYIMNLQAKRTKLVFKLFKKAEGRILLSGTPIKNRPVDFYPQLKFLRPDLFGNKMQYALRYCDAKETPFGWDYRGASNLEELNRKISPFYIRRLKNEVLKELPPKTVSVIDVDFNVTEKKEYEKIRRDFDRFLKESWVKVGTDYVAKPLDGADLSKLVEMKQYCSQAKIPRVIEFVKEFVESSENRKILVFSQFIATQKALRDAFPGISVSLLGEDSAEKRQEAVDKFQSDPKTRVFVGSTIAAGVGLTLTAADTVVFADLMWSPSDHEQAADRVHRIGQDNPVFIYYLVFKDSIESMIWAIIGKKLSIINEALDGKKVKESYPDARKAIFNQLIEEFKKNR